MNIVYFLLSLIFPFLLLISLISPKIINQKIGEEFSRKQYSYVFVGFTILFFSMFAITTPQPEDISTQKTSIDQSTKTDKKDASSQEGREAVLGSQEKEKETPTPTPSPTPPTPSPTPKPSLKPTIIPTPIPTIIPTAVPTIVPTAIPYVAPPAPVVSTSPYSCSCSKTCSQMSSCEEAYYQLNTCGCSRRDGDNDGVPCEGICN